MASLEGKLTPQDIELLIDSIGFWEHAGNQDWHIMNMVKNTVMPDEDDEAYEFVKRVKDHFSSREREIKADRRIRQEKAIFLKAKLMLISTDMCSDQVFQDATPKISESDSSDSSDVVGNNGNLEVENFVADEKSESLKKAEAFLKKTGVLKFYTEFLADQESTLDKIEQYIEECGMTSHYKQFLSEN